MGKGTITSGGDDGQYQVQINYNRESYDDQITRLDESIASAEEKVEGLENEISELEDFYNDFLQELSELSNLINKLTKEIPGLLLENQEIAHSIEGIEKEISLKETKISRLISSIAGLESQKTALEDEKATVDSEITDIQAEIDNFPPPPLEKSTELQRLEQLISDCEDNITIIESIVEDNNILLAPLESAKSELESQKATIETEKADLQEQFDDPDRLQQSLDKQTEINSKQDKVDEKQGLIDTLESDNLTLANEKIPYQDALDDLEIVYADTILEKIQKETQISEKEQELVEEIGNEKYHILHSQQMVELSVEYDQLIAGHEQSVSVLELEPETPERNDQIAFLNAKIAEYESEKAGVLNTSQAEIDLADESKLAQDTKRDELTTLSEELGVINDSLEQYELDRIPPMIEIAERDSEIATNTEQIEAETNLKEQYESEQLLLETDLSVLTAETNNLQGQINDCTTNISTITQQIADIDTQIDEIESSNMSLQNEIDELTDHVTELQTEIDNLPDVPDRDAQIAILTAQKNILIAQASALQIEIDTCSSSITTLSNQKTSLEGQVTSLEGQITSKQNAIIANNAEIEAKRSSIKSSLAASETITKRLQDVLLDKDKLLISKNIISTSILAFQKRKEYLEGNMPDDETISAWCGDLTEDLTGEVGLIEVPGESVDFNIHPGFEDNAVYNSARDGQLVPTITQTPAQAFYNLAMLPGWQKWKPTYRYATVDSVNGDTANITLESATSTQQSLDVNQGTSLSDVAIEYMDCNGVAFEDGDSVLVKFENQDFAQPKIIGFKEEPKACSTDRVKCTFNGFVATKGAEKLQFEWVHSDGTKHFQNVTLNPDGEYAYDIHRVRDRITNELINPKVKLYWQGKGDNVLFDYWQLDETGGTHIWIGFDAWWQDHPPWETLPGFQFTLADESVSTPWTINIRRKRYMTNPQLFYDFPKTKEETPEGKLIEVYTVDFSEMYYVEEQITWYDWKCNGLNSVTSTQYKPLGFNVTLNDDSRHWPPNCTDRCYLSWGECYYWGYHKIGTVTNPDITGFFIFCDDNGQNLTFEGTVLTSILDPTDETGACGEEGSPGSCAGVYEKRRTSELVKIETPQNLF